MGKRILIAVLLAILVLPTAGLFYLLYSEQGLNLLLSQIDRFGKFSMRVDGATGRLAGPLDIRRFELGLEHAHVVVENLHAELTPRALLAGVVEVRKLTAGSVNVVLTNNSEKPATPPQFLPGNLRVKIDQFELDSISFTYGDMKPMVADRLAGGVAISRQRLRVDQLHVAAPEYELDGSVDLKARKVIELAMAADGHYTLNANTFRGHAELTGVPAALLIKAQLTAPSPLNAVAKLELTEGAWKINGTANSPAFALTPWWQKASFGLRDVEVSFAASPQNMSVKGTLSVPELGALPLQLTAEGDYREHLLRIRSVELAGKNGALQVNAAGELRFGESMALQARARWRGLAWPLAANVADILVSSDSGELAISGDLPYRFSLQANVSTARTQAPLIAQVSAEGMLSKDSLSLSQYQIAALDGSLTGSGQLDFAAPQKWSVQVAARDLNPATLRREFEGRMAFQANAEGRGFNKRASFSAHVSTLSGTLRGKTLRGRGGVDYATQVWRARQLQLSLGSTQLRVDGSIGEQLALTGELHSGDLRDLDLGNWRLKGKADVRLQAQGRRAMPHVITRATSADFAFGEWQARQLDLNADLDFSSQQDSQIDARAGRVMHGDYALDVPHIAATGTMNKHRVVVTSGLGTLKSNLVTLQAELDGGYANRAWSGTLASTTISDADKRERANVLQPVTVRASADQANVGEMCFAFDESRGCAHGAWQRGGAWRLVASVNNFPLSILNSGRAESLRYEGHAAANVDLGAGEREPWRGSVNVQLADAAVSYFAASGHYESLPVSTARVGLTTSGSKLNATLDVQAGESTTLNANAEFMQNVGTLITQWPLQARVRAHSMDAKLLPLLVSDLDRATGILDADLQVTGNLVDPRLHGLLQLQQGEADIYQLNLALRELSFVARLDNDRVQLDGKARAGDGMLDVKGGFAWTNLQPSGNLHIKGDKLLVADLPEYRVIASPDLNFSVSGSHIDVVGDIAIPSARLQPQDVSGAVRTSDDARLLSGQALTQQNRWSVTSEVRISMGDDVQVDALGLQGRLTGSVGTTFKPGEPTIGRGELRIENGLYEAYGRKLEITRGRLLYEVSPLDDPGLDIQAERKINDITVGVNVRGMLRAPLLQFYSDPSMSQTEIVSYLLIGKPLDELQGSETATIQSASNTLAVQGGGFVAAQLGRRIGLEQVGVETDANNQSALVLGKFLSPRLFLSYGISLTQAINTLKLRYTLSDHWTLKTESGNAQSADVEFRIDH